jgi:hypothetical protein
MSLCCWPAAVTFRALYLLAILTKSVGVTFRTLEAMDALMGTID